MIIKIVVAGSRHFSDYSLAEEYICDCLQRVCPEDTPIFLSGECRGADKLGERFAEEHGFMTEKHPALWKKYGKAAGAVRNKEMAEACDFAICFWDGKSSGTRMMIDYAKKLGKPVFVKIVSGEE